MPMYTGASCGGGSAPATRSSSPPTARARCLGTDSDGKCQPMARDLVPPHWPDTLDLAIPDTEPAEPTTRALADGARRPATRTRRRPSTSGAALGGSRTGAVAAGKRPR